MWLAALGSCPRDLPVVMGSTLPSYPNMSSSPLKLLCQIFCYNSEKRNPKRSPLIISRTCSSHVTKTWFQLSKHPFPPLEPPTFGDYCSLLCLYEFDKFRIPCPLADLFQLRQSQYITLQFYSRCRKQQNFFPQDNRKTQVSIDTQMHKENIGYTYNVTWSKWGQLDGASGKGSCWQAWRLMFDSQAPNRGKRKPALMTCPLTSKRYTILHEYTHKCKKKVNV